MSSFDFFIRLADRLGQVAAGSLLADLTIHNAIGAEGEVQPYTSREAEARLLLPDGFEWREAAYSGGLVYASCRRMGLDGESAHSHSGQWGATAALAMCGAAIRARARLMKITSI